MERTCMLSYNEMHRYEKCLHQYISVQHLSFLIPHIRFSLAAVWIGNNMILLNDIAIPWNIKMITFNSDMILCFMWFILFCHQCCLIQLRYSLIQHWFSIEMIDLNIDAINFRKNWLYHCFDSILCSIFTIWFNQKRSDSALIQLDSALIRLDNTIPTDCIEQLYSLMQIWWDIVSYYLIKHWYVLIQQWWFNSALMRFDSSPIRLAYLISVSVFNHFSLLFSSNPGV